MSELLSGKTAIVTGAASGIGRGISRTLGEHGTDVVVADVREEPRQGGRPTHELVPEETGQRAVFTDCDVTDRGDFEVAVDAAEEFGGVDIHVNNAGIFRWEDSLEVTEPEFDQMIGVNTKGLFLGSQVAGERMIENDDGGSIINITSIAGLIGDGDQISYSTSKGGATLLTYSFADSLGTHGVRVNAIAPGGIDTDIAADEDDPPTDSSELAEEVPLGRPGEPEEIGGAAVFLASDLASYVNGETLVVDGGYTFTL